MPSAGASTLHIRGKDVTSGEVVHVQPNGADWRYIDFRVLRLTPGQRLNDNTRRNELVIVVINGTIDVATANASWASIGGRVDPFSGLPSAIFVSVDTAYSIVARDACEVALCAAQAQRSLPTRLINLSSTDEYVRGEGNAQRRIRNIAMGDDEATSLFVTEVVTLPGNWSSYPPHKHDEDKPPHESALEEIYYYRAQPKQGFAFQRVYTPSGDLDETMTVHDSDAVLVPRGYHVCAAAAQYWIYYLNVLAGPKHVYRMSFDPAHAWIKEDWTW